ncbi:shikimate kinase [Spirochaetia bacterium]|nr:shikimate kinase [Spirochaetia bacterium]
MTQEEKENNKIILLTGPKHSGKTSTARLLSWELGVEYFDTDSIIEKQNNKTVRELYRESIELFKEAELNALKTILSSHNNDRIIVAAGGGLIDNETAINILKHNPQIVFIYLEVEAETAWRRILTNAKRIGRLPAFLEGANAKEKHTALHKRRSAAYKECADITISTGNKSIENIVKEIKCTIPL